MIYRTKNRKQPRTKTTNTTKMADNERSKFKSWFCGILFCFLWYLSILVGFFVLICPILPLVLIRPKLYRKWSDIVFGMWEPYPVAMMEILFGVRINISGEQFNPFEGSLIIMNHRTRLDWNFLWAAMFHCSHPHSHNLKFVLKAPIMHVPGPGWVMQACSFVFIHRNWERDQQLLTDILDYLKDTNQVCQILLFPEGTDLSLKNVERSHRYADAKGLERYSRVLHPKTTGFSFLAQRMRMNGQLQAVYDLTVGYPNTLPETEMDLLRGKFPQEIYFDIKRYDLSDLPAEHGELKTWLTSVWRRKEEKLHRFYSDGSFTGDEVHNLYKLNGMSCSQVSSSSSRRPSNVLYLALLFWTGLVMMGVHQLLTDNRARVWTALHSFLFIFISCCTKGFHHIVANCYTYVSPSITRVNKKFK